MRALFFTLLLLLLNACASVPADEQTTRDQIAAATKAWQAAYDTRDPKSIVDMYDMEAVLWGTAAKTIAPDPAAVREYFKNAASRPNARVVIGEQHIRVFGETAFSSGYYTFTDVRDGQVVPRPATLPSYFTTRRASGWSLPTTPRQCPERGTCGLSHRVRPNPTIEGMPKRLRLLCTPHVTR